VTGDEGYLLDNQQAEAGQRFDALSQLFDPVTFRHLAAVGVSAGWACWEVGAGGVSVPAWLAEQVGPSGWVLASDIDTAWMPAEGAAFEVLRHDVGVEQPPAGGFDLVHARLLLTHVPRRIEALASMVRALRQGFRTLMAGRGAELAFGRTLPRLLRGAGLDAVQADAFFPITSPACIALEIATVHQIRERLLAAGLATEAEIEQHLTNVASGRLDLATAPLISAWGRKPH